MKKYIARLVKWSGEVIEQEIKREWAEGIAAAVEGQFMFIDNVSKFCIKGGDFVHVDVYEVAV